MEISCQQLSLVSLECELLKDDFCEELPIPKFLELGDDILFCYRMDSCGIARHDFNVFMTCFHK